MSRWPRVVASVEKHAAEKDAGQGPPTAIEQELRAMRICHAEIEILSPDARMRVLLWLSTVHAILPTRPLQPKGESAPASHRGTTEELP